MEIKCFPTSDHNKFTNNIPDAKIREKSFFNEPDILGFVNTSDLDDKMKILETKAELKAE